MEAVAQAVLLAVDFRQRFHRDVVIDLWTYRRHGHNEGDEPSFTQPVMYRAISRKPTLKALYAQQLVKEGALAPGEVDQMVARYRARLEEAYHASAKIAVQPGAPGDGRLLEGLPRRADGPGGAAHRRRAGGAAPGRASCSCRSRAASACTRSSPRCSRRARRWSPGEKPLDWAMAEALALGTLAWEGTRIRLTGQDVRRGTFSHRHAVLYDHESGVPYSALSHLRSGQGPVEIRDSLLSEAGALGFEYGYSLEMPDALTMWEAQFGDFVNAAQVIIDQFLSSGEAKWNRLSGLALLLPHGMEGQGPEHSSARLERFLELSRGRQLARREPHDARAVLPRAAPPGPLALPQAARGDVARRASCATRRSVSPLDLLAGERFRPVIDDESADPTETTRVVLCSGKLYYDLAAAREAQGARHAAIVRLEQLYPLDVESVRAAVARLPPRGRDRVGAGGAVEHGRVGLRERPPRAEAPVARRARRARAVGEPGRGVCDAPPARAGAARARGPRRARLADPRRARGRPGALTTCRSS